MAHRLGMQTSGTWFSVIFDVGLKPRPVVLHTYSVKGLRLAKVSCEGMVVREEHGVVNSRFPVCICIRNVVVDRLDRGSTWDWNVTGGQGVLQKWGHLVSET